MIGILKRSGSNESRFMRGFALALAAVMMSGCPASNQTATHRVVIRGSNTFGEELGPRLINEYKKDHPDADIDLQAKATGYGLAELRKGTCTVAAASRPAAKEELDEAHRLGVEMNDHAICTYTVTVIVNNKSAVTNLTREQVRDIFTGKITNWKELNGPDAAIHLYVRDPVSGTSLGFKELAMDNKEYAEGRRLATSYKEIAQQVAQDDSGIGYVGFEIPKDQAVKGISIGEMPVSATNINSGKYPYARVLHLYTNKGTDEGATKDFVDFVMSTHGQGIVSQMGFAQHP